MKIIEHDLQFAKLVKRTHTDMLVLHHSASSTASVEQIHALHTANGWGGIGYHYLVRKDGSVYRGRPEDTIGAHAKGNNQNSIGICFEGNFELEQMHEAQAHAGSELIRDILERYEGIKVVCHRDLAATACPGKFFPTIESFLDSKPGVDIPALSEPSEWAKEACDWAIANGIFLGDGKGNYNWHRGITREELAVIMMRMKDLLKNTKD